mmetsp:Transcript_5847/g.10217  ORF Transcript_5847/g.10217 Transcript_5847/m.10217 type:complete len:569 (-) Transcript_5847:104-1810(-)
MIFFSRLALGAALNIYAVNANLVGTECATGVLPISCENRHGYFRQLDGGPIEELKGSEVVKVATRQKVAVAICNVGNQVFNDDTELFVEGLVKGVVEGVGKEAHVRVDIVNSGNIQLNNANLAIGEKMPPGGTLPPSRPGQQPTPPDQPDISIIHQVVTGIIENNVHISVKVQQSANIVMNGDHSIDIFRGDLLGEIINGDNNHPSQDSCFEITVTDSCNVKNSATLGRLHILDGQLDDEGLDFPVSGGTVFVNKNNVSNVHIGQVYIEEGELSDESVDVANLTGMDIVINVRGSSNVDANTLHLVEAELIDEVFDAYNVQLCHMQLSVANSGNARIRDYSFFNESELVDESFDFHDFSRSQIWLDVKNTGNIFCQRIDMFGSELVDEHVDVFNIYFSQIFISASNIANAQAGGALYITNGELLDEVIDCNDIEDAQIIQTVSNAANVRAAKLVIQDGQLLDEMLDANHTQRLTLNMAISDCANHYGSNIHGSELTIENGELMETIVDSLIEGSETNTYNVDLRHSSNSQNNHVTLGVNATLLKASDTPNLRMVNSGKCSGDVSCNYI